MPIFLLIPITKFVSYWIQLFGFGSGSTWPGEIALQLNRQFIQTIFNQNPQLLVVYVTGTNGKTTTSHLIAQLLQVGDKRVLTNETGANLLNGVASTLLKGATWFGRLPYAAAVIEVDENVLPLLLKAYEPTALVVLNLFRDQLDRYGEVNVVSAKWEDAFSRLTTKTTLIVNGTDPELLYLGEKMTNVQVQFFGIPTEYMLGKTLGPEADQLFCPRCSHRLTFAAIAYSHLGAFHCPACKLASPKLFTVPKPKTSQLLGLFNYYNLTAAILTAQVLTGITTAEASRKLEETLPAFGRQELIRVRKRNIILQLAKNPAGFNQAMSILTELPGEKRVALLLNDRIPDGRDVSWIWDVDFSPVVEAATSIYLGGDRAKDLALRLEYQQGHQLTFINHAGSLAAGNLIINQSLDALIDRAINETPEGSWLIIFPTYSAMLDVRKLLKGNSLNV